MNAITTYFAMGGYAVFVWPAYALTAAAMIWLAVAYISRLRRFEREAAALSANSPRRGTERLTKVIVEVRHDA